MTTSTGSEYENDEEGESSSDFYLPTKTSLPLKRKSKCQKRARLKLTNDIREGRQAETEKESQSDAGHNLFCRWLPQQCIAKQNGSKYPANQRPQSIEERSMLTSTGWEASRGTNSKQGFQAAAFHEPWCRDHYGFEGDDEAFLSLLQCHWNYEHFESPFISMSPSLPWVLSRALKMKDPAIAIIDSNVLSESREIVYGNPFCKKLQDAHRLQRPRYHATCEWLAFAEIELVAIVSVFTFKSLLQLARSDNAVGDFLQLDNLLEKKRCEAFRDTLGDVPLDRPIGLAIGRLIAFFAPQVLDTRSYLATSLAHTLLQSWRVRLEGIRWKESPDFNEAVKQGLAEGRKRVPAPTRLLAHPPEDQAESSISQPNLTSRRKTIPSSDFQDINKTNPRVAEEHDVEIINPGDYNLPQMHKNCTTRGILPTWDLARFRYHANESDDGPNIRDRSSSVETLRGNPVGSEEHQNRSLSHAMRDRSVPLILPCNPYEAQRT
ncbi:MAG: hypothetical protein M1831_002698 [Alyxoria varia]|nr:MAG: hypothetical protein M1831_002698 [Alyxoria varia]